jgi:hypothetical protein
MKNIILYTIKIIVTYAMTLPFFYLIMVVPEESLGIFFTAFYVFSIFVYIFTFYNWISKYIDKIFES